MSMTNTRGTANQEGFAGRRSLLGGVGSLGFRVVLKAGVSPASHIWEWE